MNFDRRCTVRRRRGSVSHEAVLAVALAITVLLGVAQMLTLVAQERRAADLRATATREAGNVMERLMSQPWDQVTAEATEAWSLSENCRQRLPAARLSIDVVTQEDAADAKRIQVEVHWHSTKAPGGHAVRLVAFRYHPEEPAP
jgi:hypothetical protein